MADLYSTLGAGSTRRVLTRSDVTGPETTWLICYDSDGSDQWEGGETWNPTATLTPGDDQNYRAIVECIQQYCEVYEVVRPGGVSLAIKVRANSVPYAEGESALDGGVNTPLTAIVQAHPGLGSTFSVWNGRFQGNNISYD